MKVIFSHRNIIFIHHIKNILENHKIACILEEGHSLDPVLAPEGRILLLDEAKFEEAEELISTVFKEDALEEKQSWVCSRCSKEIEPQFSECWYCAVSRGG